MREIKKMAEQGMIDPEKDDPFELFISATTIRFTYYKDTHNVIGNTYGMCVLQDFEALTPNLLARTIETVEGGGIIVILLRTMTSLRQLYSLTMDVHSHFRTEAHSDIRPRFNERFILSLANCHGSLVVDDELNILPLSDSANTLHKGSAALADQDFHHEQPRELKDLKESLRDTQPVGALVAQAGTIDQAKAILTFVEAISEKSLRNTVTLTAARGRGKSAALGISIAAALAYGYSNIFVTAPSPENLKTLFEFVFKGLDALDWKEHSDYTLVRSTQQETKDLVVRINLFRTHRQTIQYIRPQDAHVLSQAELLVIDEAAAIPLPLVKNLLGPYLVFMSSTINGYEGTGRSLSLKLIAQLRRQSAEVRSNDANATEVAGSSGVRVLKEIELEEPLRYAAGDGIEKWLNSLLCLDAAKNLPRLFGAPHPSKCNLYWVNRDTLFSYHPASEEFLQRMMALYVASHYKNTPNDLQLMSDAPAHHLFALLGPQDADSTQVPDILCVVQIALEGEISKDKLQSEMGRGQRSAGDLIPWTLSQQFQDQSFAGLTGARIVRIASHPDVMRMGYGSRAIELLQRYYLLQIRDLAEAAPTKPKKKSKTRTDDSGDLLNETLAPRSSEGTLLERLEDRPPENLHWIGTSFGLTLELFQFWNKAGLTPVYLRQTPNDLTGEFTTVMLKSLHESAVEGDVAVGNPNWLKEFHSDFLKRFRYLLAFQFRSFPTSLSLSILAPALDVSAVTNPLSTDELDTQMSPFDLRRLEMYSKNLVDHHLITDTVPVVAQWFFGQRIPVSISFTQAAILAGMGLQHHTVDEVATDLNLPTKQVLALFNKLVRKMSTYFTSIKEKQIAQSMPSASDTKLTALPETLDETLKEASAEMKSRLSDRQKELLEQSGLAQYAITADDEEWSKSLPKSGVVQSISVKSNRPKAEEEPAEKKRKTAPRSDSPKKKSKFKNLGKK
eukprot:c3081_g1_i1.p1 GENE.c3081_g1_i1~~c3081_g1_i1.p1  ORF type:complete len:1038 (+),score=231.72 c3081_g1_i1:245-3115(+)